ncbi:hypothetical protein [Streptomyces sp. NPDC017673]|uniref:hypothetical protein n=1 Tax=unclassified Streptomyces TaxID=2593676 RepID=UPI0037A9E189
MAGSTQHPLLARYAQVRAQLAQRYGPDSQAVVFLLYEELLSLRTVLLENRAAREVGARVGALAREIQRRYDHGGIVSAGRDRRRLVHTDPPLIEYDRPAFDRMYAPLLDDRRPDVLHVTSAADAFAALSPGSTHIYVVDDRDRLLVWPEPFTLAETVFGRTPDRRRQGARVVHPMLVPERLRVRAAGELVLLGDAHDCMVVANLKSGHFLPPPACAPALRTVLERVLPVAPGDVDIFTLPEPPPGPRAANRVDALR